MTSKTIFNMNTKLKKAAMKKARAEGWTLSAMLNQATKAYVDNRIGIDVLDEGLAEGLADIKAGRVVSFGEVKRKVAELRGK